MFWNGGGYNSSGSPTAPGALARGKFGSIGDGMPQTGPADFSPVSGSGYGLDWQHSSAAKPVARPGGAFFFSSPFSTTGWGYSGPNGQIGLDVRAPGSHATVHAAPSGYGLPTPNGMSEKDAQYFLNHAGARYELANRLLPFSSAMARLKAGNYGLFNTQLGLLNSQFNEQKQGALSQMAANGVYQSGGRDLAMQDMARQYGDQRTQLSRQLGTLAVSDIQNQMADARRQYRNDLMKYLLQAYTNKQKLDTVNGLGG